MGFTVRLLVAPGYLIKEMPVGHLFSVFGGRWRCSYDHERKSWEGKENRIRRLSTISRHFLIMCLKVQTLDHQRSHAEREGLFYHPKLSPMFSSATPLRLCSVSSSAPSPHGFSELLDFTMRRAFSDVEKCCGRECRASWCHTAGVRLSTTYYTELEGQVVIEFRAKSTKLTTL